MPLRSDWSENVCPVARALDVVGDPWVLLIVRNVLHGHGRFDALRKSLGVSEPVLSRRLHAMVDAGLLVRVDYTSGGRTRQGYAATEAATELLPIIQQLAVWGERHTAMPPGSAHMAMIHEACGNETTQGQVCSACGRILVPEEMTWVKPWWNTREALVPAGILADLSGSRARTV
jgi:DNA-binding HxlR family transcriptional regulator